jgi:hypothetical protein
MVDPKDLRRVGKFAEEVQAHPIFKLKSGERLLVDETTLPTIVEVVCHLVDEFHSNYFMEGSEKKEFVLSVIDALAVHGSSATLKIHELADGMIESLIRVAKGITKLDHKHRRGCVRAVFHRDKTHKQKKKTFRELS